MIEIVIHPRRVLTWEEFLEKTPSGSVALDGYVSGGPRWDEKGLRANFDHHSGVVREATMSTAMQVYFAIKGGLFERMRDGRVLFVRAYVNDPDQDTSLATWLMKKHAMFEGTQSHPVIGRLLALNDRLDVTGGAFPMALDDDLLEMHNWIFRPYSDLRTSGKLAEADAAEMRNCIEAVHRRLDQVLMGQAGREPLRAEAEVVYQSPMGFWAVDEQKGGNEGRYALYARGMRAFVALVSSAPDGTHVYSIGRRSQYVRFPLPEIYEALNRAEGRWDVWGGSDIIGGCGRAGRSKLSLKEISEIVEGVITRTT